LLRSKWTVGKAVRAGLAVEGAYLNRYVTDEQRSRRPIFIATLWAGASWLFFRVAHSTRMTKIWVLRSRLEKQPTHLRHYTCYVGDRALGVSKVKKSGSQGAKIARVFAAKTRGLGFILSVCLFATCHWNAFAQSQYQSSTDFAKFAIKLRENGLLTFGSSIGPTLAGRNSALIGGLERGPWKTGIVTTIFWIGERPTTNNPEQETFDLSPFPLSGCHNPELKEFYERLLVQLPPTCRFPSVILTQVGYF